MNLKAVIPLGLAAVFGLIAAVLVHNAMAKKASQATQVNTGISVVAAKHNIEAGAALTGDDLKIINVAPEAAPTQVYSDPAKLIGRVAQVPMLESQPVVDTLLAPTGTGSGLQALIPPGMRAITLEISEFSGVAGMLVPGARVDVISILSSSKTHEQLARTVLQNIKITAVGRSTAPPAPPQPGQPAAGPANSVTLLCTPKQAQVLHLASAVGRPWLILRNGRDNESPETDGTPIAELRGDNTDENGVDAFAQNTEAQSAQPVTPVSDVQPTTRPTSETVNTRRVVQVIRGGAESQVVFQIPTRTHAVTADADSGDADN